MATLNTSESSKAVKGRTKKPAPRIDLTAMVDLMFLLTAFFMLTTSIGQPKAADISKPDQTNLVDMPYPESRTMTILLGKNGQAVSYMGTVEKASMKQIALSNIQAEIQGNKFRVAATYPNNPKKYMIVIIKPTETAKYQDFVDAIDEMKIGGIQSYTLDDRNISPKEADFMKTKGI